MPKLSLIHQQGALRSYFPSSKIIRKGESELIWIGDLQPTPLSQSYTVKLHYKYGSSVKVFVIGQTLPLAKDQTKLPHVYSTYLQQLCLYYPKDNEWHSGMFYVKTLIPWTSEWLYHYEVWVGTGKWCGGGIDHESGAEEGERNEKKQMQ